MGHGSGEDLLVSMTWAACCPGCPICPAGLPAGYRRCTARTSDRSSESDALAATNPIMMKLVTARQYQIQGLHVMACDALAGFVRCQDSRRRGQYQRWWRGAAFVCRSDSCRWQPVRKRQRDEHYGRRLSDVGHHAVICILRQRYCLLFRR